MADRDVESIRSKAKFVLTLRRVADAIEGGKPVRIQVAGQRLLVPVDAVMSIEHEAEGGEEELELQLRWRSDSGAETRPAKPAKRKAPKRKAPKRKQ
jgi:amphi-Trp domain-containing protein